MRACGTIVTALVVTSAASGQCVRDWLPLGTGLDSSGIGSLVWDPDGTGPQRALLVVSGYSRTNCSNEFHELLAWDGQTWCPLGDGPYAYTMVVRNGQLFAGGSFTTAGGQPANNVARWDGSNWHPLGLGTNRAVSALASYKGELIAAGTFELAGGQPANYIARWDGLLWRPLGAGITGGNGVICLTVSNGDLIAGGYFTSAGGQPATNIASWDSGAWHPLGDGPGFTEVRVLTVYNGQLLAGGHLAAPNQPQTFWIARWTGSSWSVMGENLTFSPRVFAQYNGELFVGGIGPGPLVRWNGAGWDQIPGAGFVNAMSVYNGDLVVQGSAGSNLLNIARWACPCYANCDTSVTIPALNVNDFICFQQAYARGDMYANCDGSTIAPVLNIADFVCFMSRFAAGCP